MLLIRSLLFNTAFYLNLALWLVAAMVTMVLPPRFLLMIYIILIKPSSKYLSYVVQEI